VKKNNSLKKIGIGFNLSEAHEAVFKQLKDFACDPYVDELTIRLSKRKDQVIDRGA
jgi:hypothetical protein